MCIHEFIYFTIVFTTQNTTKCRNYFELLKRVGVTISTVQLDGNNIIRAIKKEVWTVLV